MDLHTISHLALQDHMSTARLDRWVCIHQVGMTYLVLVSLYRKSNFAIAKFCQDIGL